MQLVEDKGIDGFSMREAARVAGVSSGAPYRHFSDKAALLRAVSNEARGLLSAGQERAMRAWGEPAAAFRAMGVSTVAFAVQRPELFLLLSDRRYRDPDDPTVQAQEAHARQVMAASQRAAAETDDAGRDHDPALVMLAAHAMTYGLARMFLDGHMTDEGVSTEQAEEVATAVLNVLGMGFFRASGGED